MSEPVAAALARHLVALRFEDIPKRLVDDAKALLLDYLAVALCGSRTETGEIAKAFARRQGGPAEASLIGSDGRVSAMHAAFANAISSHSIELDDVDILALYHFSPPVVSAGLATAQAVKANGRAFLTAVVAGCEMMARLSDGANPSLRDRGFHTTPTCGVFGAAIAASRLMGLSEEQTVWALGLAGAQASGLMEMYGPSMQKRFNPGPAARNGVVAADMARMGFSGAATIIDGERGFGRGFTDRFDADAALKGLGEEFPIFIEYKAHSSARPIHNAVDCALDVRRQASGALDPARVVKMTMWRHPAWANYHLNRRPTTIHEAQVSLPYSVAVALVDGAASLPQYAEERLSQSALARLADLIEVVPDPALPRGVSCKLVVELDDGRRLASQVDYPKGSIKNPMTKDEHAGKIHMLADPVIGGRAVDDLIAACAAIENEPSLERLMGIAASSRH